MAQYELEKKKAIEYMAGIQSRVAITTDLWTSDNQKRGYIAIMAYLLMNLGILEILSWGTNFFLRSSCISFCSDQVAYHVSYFVCNYWMTGSFMSLLLTLLKPLVKNCMTVWLSGILMRRYLQLLLTTALQMMQLSLCLWGILEDISSWMMVSYCICVNCSYSQSDSKGWVRGVERCNRKHPW